MLGVVGCGGLLRRGRRGGRGSRAGARLAGEPGLALLDEVADLRVQAGDQRLLARDQALHLGLRRSGAADELPGLHRLDAQQVLPALDLALGDRDAVQHRRLAARRAVHDVDAVRRGPRTTGRRARTSRRSGRRPCRPRRRCSASCARAAARLALRDLQADPCSRAIRCLTPVSLDWARVVGVRPPRPPARTGRSAAARPRAPARAWRRSSRRRRSRGAEGGQRVRPARPAATTGASRRRCRCVGGLDMARDFTTCNRLQTQAFL